MMSKRKPLGRKALALLLCVAMLLSFSVTALADADNTAVITLGSASDVHPGDTVTVAATISNNPGYAAFAMFVTYDKDAMTLTGISGTYGDQTSIAAPNYTLNTGGLSYMNDAENITANGPLVFFTFTISEDAAAGNYSVSMMLRENDSTNFCNYEEEDVPVEFVAGTITVVSDGDDTTLNGGSVITKGGAYSIADGATGVITVATTEKVTLIGNDESGKFANLSIDCTEAGAALSIVNLWISAPANNDVPPIRFTGQNNSLYFAGTNWIQVTGYNASTSCINVPAGASLTINGSGELSLYCGGGGSCIGGADSATNGDITIDGGTIYGYSSRAGSCIGSGQKTAMTGSLTINGGEINLYANARGAAIGSGGLSSNTVGNGGNVTVNDGNLTLYVAFTGSAIGNGGGNNAAANNLGDGFETVNGGNLSVCGGSIKTILMKNAQSAWLGETGTEDVVNDIAITAMKLDASGDDVYLLTLPIGEAEADEDGNYTVKVDGDEFYTGAATATYSSFNTYGMWSGATTDPNFYLYLTGEEHTVSVNGVETTYTFDSETETFTVKGGDEPGPSTGAWDGSVDTSWYNTTDRTFTLTTGAQLAGLSAIVNGTASGIEQDSFRGKTILLGGDIMMNEDDSISVTHTGTHGSAITTTINVADTAHNFTPIGNLKYTSSGAVESGYAFLGTFDGQGHSIRNLYVESSSGYLGLFGSVGGTDTASEAGYGTVKSFKLYGLIYCTASDTSADFVGGVCGILNAGGTISDVVNYANIEAKGCFNVGGIAGFAGTPVAFGYSSKPSGYNTFILRCGNEQTVHGYNKVGGIVGENASTVMYCYNKGWILPHMHGTGGGWGGISGRNGNNNAATEESIIAYCYNTAEITNGGKNDDANETIKGYTGISGMTYGGHGRNEVYNCYNVGAIPAGRNNYNSIATNVESNGQAAVRNNYSLISDLIKNYSNTATTPWETGIQKTEAELKATTYNDGDILTLLGAAFVADTANINGGYPVLFWEVGKSLPALESIAITTAPTKTAYNATEEFDCSGMVVTATYEGGAKAVIGAPTGLASGSAVPLSGGYSISPSEALTVSDTAVTVSYTEGGVTKTATQAITVSGLTLTGIEITTAPTNTYYAQDEEFDPAGMVVTAIYNDTVRQTISAQTDEANGYTYTVDRAAGTVTVSFTDGEVTKTAKTSITFSASVKPTASDGVYELATLDDLTWFANQVDVCGNTGINGILTDDITIPGPTWKPIGLNQTGKKFAGTFDGNGKTISMTISDVPAGISYVGLFGYTDGATIKNLTVNADITKTTSGSYGNGIIVAAANATTLENLTATGSVNAQHAFGGIAGVVNGASSIENCTNRANITCGGNAGGIAYNASFTGTISQCANYGNITSSTSNVGGIAGQTGSSVTVDQCFNKGSITATYDVGGVVGANSGKITNSYNTGDVTATTTGTFVYRCAGGVAGNTKATGALSNVFSTGSISSTKAPDGDATSCAFAITYSNNAAFTVSSAYYLTGSAPAAIGERTAGRVTQTNVEDKTADEFADGTVKALLGDKFDQGTATPILTWQPSEKAKFNVTLTPSKTQVDLGETFTVDLVVTGGDFNAYDITVTYDTTLFTSADDTAAAGSINLVDFDKTYASGDTVKTLTFTSVENLTEAKTGTFGLTKAEIAVKVESMGSDPYVAETTGATVSVVPEYDVTFVDKDGAKLSETITVAVGSSISESDIPTAPAVEYHDFAGWNDGSGDILSASEIAQKAVTASVTYTAAYTPKTFTVTVGEGITAAGSATYGTDYTGTVNGDAYHTYTVTATIGDSSNTYYADENGSFTIPGADITGDMTLTCTKMITGVSVSLYTDYVGGYTLIVVHGYADAYTYDGKDMFRTAYYDADTADDEADKAFAYIIEGKTTVEDVIELLDTTAKAAVEITASYDVNGTGSVNISDVQAVADCYNVADSVAKHMDVYLRADVDGNHIVNSTDATLVLLHRG